MAIATLEKKLWIQRTQLDEHKHYFSTLYQNKILMLTVLLLPAFITGWKSARAPSAARGLRQWGKFVLISIIRSLPSIPV